MDRATRPWSPLTWAPTLLLVPCLIGAAPGEALDGAVTSLEAGADDPEVVAQADLEKAEAMARKGQFRSAQVHYQR
ncbi:MAG: hypothetical protein O2799_08815, partial [Planctomycetota bacterium]|nr:hypothetical protein [Planctomycetota bacterium]